MITRIGPQPGPQEDFLSTSADIAIYGGAAGGGKTFGLLLEAMRHSYVPGYMGVIFRQTYGDITNPGSLWDVSQELYPLAGAVPKASNLSWTFENDTRVEFHHFGHAKYKANWQGSQVPFIGWDELTHFSEDIFFYMLSRNRSTCGVKPYVRATCNPDPDSWVKGFIQWWIDEETGYYIPERVGIIRYFLRVSGEITWFDSLQEIAEDQREFAKSVTFIPAKLSDNPALTNADPAYLANLMALPHHQREALLSGNWNVRLAAGDFFKRSFFEIIEEAPTVGIRVRSWDRAATEVSASSPDPDWTVGTLLRLTPDGTWYVEDVIRKRLRPLGVRKLMRNTASHDGPSTIVVIEEDPGQAGKADSDILIRYLAGYSVKTIRPSDKKAVRAQPVSAQCEHGNVKVVRGKWNRTWFNELEAFPDPLGKVHDDQVDSLSAGFNHISLAMKRPGIRYLE